MPKSLSQAEKQIQKERPARAARGGQCWPTVIPGQSSVRNGEAGWPEPP